MKLTKPNYSEWIFYLLNIIFVLLIFYPLFFVSFFSLGSKEDHINIMETEQIQFIAFRFLFDVFFVVIMMMPICKKRRRLLQQNRSCCYSSEVAKLMFFS